MDYIETAVCERMKKVVTGEDQDGISHSVNWKVADLLSTANYLNIIIN